MNRQDVLEQYKVDPRRGVILSPGKFEGEMLYVPYLWELILDGEGQEAEGDAGVVIDQIEVSDEDRLQFPELKDDEAFNLYEDEQGFVHCSSVEGPEA